MSDDNDDKDRERVVEAADLVSRITEFVGALSGHEGAELPQSEHSVALDASRLLAELRKTLGMPSTDPVDAQSGRGDGDGDGDDDDSGSEGSSFFSEGDEEDDDEGDDAGWQDSDHADRGGGQAGHTSGFATELERQMKELLGPPVFHSERSTPGPNKASASTGTDKVTMPCAIASFLNMYQRFSMHLDLC